MPSVRKAVFGSSTISGFAYDEDAQLLDIEFTNGGVYTFRRVPKTVVDDFERAESAGKFYHSEIKGRYT